MAAPSILAELPKYTSEAVRFYWQTRSQQSEKQRKAGGSDQGSRSASPVGRKWMGLSSFLQNSSSRLASIVRIFTTTRHSNYLAISVRLSVGIFWLSRKVNSSPLSKQNPRSAPPSEIISITPP